jgi:hypothetical protein
MGARRPGASTRALSLSLTLLLPALLCLHMASAHTCVHDAITTVQPPSIPAPQRYPPRPRGLGESTTTAQRAPLRITFNTSDLTDAGALSSTQVAMLVGTVMPAIATNYASMLNVTRVVGGLFASRRCTARFNTGPLTGTCAGYSTALPQCGVGAVVPIPVDYLAPAYGTCTNETDVPGSCPSLPSGTGVPDSDLVRWVCKCACVVAVGRLGEHL